MLLPFNVGSRQYSFLHVIPDIDPLSGGTVAALVGLAIAQRELGLAVSVVTTVAPGSDDREIRRLRENGVNVTTVPVQGRMRSMRPIVKVLSRLIPRAEYIHVHAVWEELQHQACRLAHKHGKPYIVSPHGMLDPWSLGQGRLKKQAYLAWRLRENLNRAAAIHCTTTTEASLLVPLGLRASKVIIPNGIELSEFADGGQQSSADQFIQQFPDAAGKKIVLFLSRLHPKKGLDLLLPAFEQCTDENAVLVIAGPGEAAYVDQLRREVARLNLQRRVIFTGMLYGPARIAALRAASVYVLPSYQENFGIAVVEALAAGTPVIISDQVNLADTIKQTDVGEVIETTVGSLASTLNRWLAEPARCREAGVHGKEFARQFAFESVAKQWADYFTSMRAARKKFARKFQAAECV